MRHPERINLKCADTSQTRRIKSPRKSKLKRRQKVPRAPPKVTSTLLPEVEALHQKPNKIHHILTPNTQKHGWNKVVKNPLNWDEVARIISEVMMKGVQCTYKNQAFKKILRIGNETVEVIYVIIDGKINISNAWVIS